MCLWLACLHMPMKVTVCSSLLACVGCIAAWTGQCAHLAVSVHACPCLASAAESACSSHTCTHAHPWSCRHSDTQSSPVLCMPSPLFTCGPCMQTHVRTSLVSYLWCLSCILTHTPQQDCLSLSPHLPHTFLTQNLNVLACRPECQFGAGGVG